ncbi:MAG TPA: sulfate transporter CysZ [Nitrospirae bacterium]|nr:sulfate transporter CysZ [Nitrospirota bacterium]
MIRDFISGIKYLLQGFRLVITPGMRRFVLIPLVINTFVFSLAIWFGTAQFYDLLNWLLPQADVWWAEFARAGLWFFFAAVVLLLLLFTFSIAANLLGSPFNGLLSEKVECYLSGSAFEDSGGLRGIISGILPSIKSELRKLLYFLILAGGVLILSLIPIINIISPFLWILFTSWTLSLEYIAYPMENHQIYFSGARAGLRKRKALGLGFGMAAMTATLIPLVNFVVMPAAVAGATAMWVERFKHEKDSEHKINEK